MTSHPSTRSNYVKQPTLPLKPGATILHAAEIWSELRRSADLGNDGAPTIAIDCYPGVEIDELIRCARNAMPDFDVINTEELTALDPDRIHELIAADLTDDRVFGVMSHLKITSFFDAAKLRSLAHALSATGKPTVLVGWGASLVPTHIDRLIIADLARWEIQQRQRRGAPNWRASNSSEDPLRKYKRGFFVEWRVADRHKAELFDRADYILDTNRGATDATMVSGDDFREAMRTASERPFRVVPFFDPGVWGGQWMKDKLDLDPSAPNYAWCFDCVPEENSLLLEADGRLLEIPAMDLVLMHPRELLGSLTFARFGAEFPIRFDFLDTMGGGNLSLQVHPLTGYIQSEFGMNYTQDESYYLLDAGDDAVVYLGLKSGIDPEEMVSALQDAAMGHAGLDVERYVNRLPAKKHDHFSIPAGTVHCSGANSMVLEISATPFIFTFKLWDWGRLGLDGIPRPTHLDHGAKNIQWDRDEEWVSNLHVTELIAETHTYREERTGLHELEFIEVRRHWFSGPVGHDTMGTVNVLNLVAGDEVEVVSPSGAFEPYTVHYAETFIVPAGVGEYLIQPTVRSESTTFATVKAYVRGTQADRAWE